MIKQYLKQAFYMLKEAPLISSISICGTALSICMILVVVLMFQVQTANYSPENARDRTLYVGSVATLNKSDKKKSSVGGMSPGMVKECFYSLKTPIAVSAYTSWTSPVSIPGKRLYRPYTIKFTDAGFWNIFSFRFLAGQAFTEADFLSGIPRAVISEGTAKRMYGTKEVVGKSLILNYTEYRICGVVEDVTRAAWTAFSEIWVPYTASEQAMATYGEEKISGTLSLCMMAADKEDFQAIRTELKGKIAGYNATKTDLEVDLLNAPVTNLDILIGSEKASTQGFLMETGLLLLFLLFVPALNLTGVTQSAVQKRQAEIGVRKAFGATSGRLLSQILCENCLTTFIGGIIGLLLSFPILFLTQDFLLPMGTVALNMDMLFRPGVFAAALLFCLLLNLMSAGIPAVRMARASIVSTLNNEESKG